MFISVSQAAKKFNISKQKIILLCEQGQIEEAKKVDGDWKIPEAVFHSGENYDSISYMKLHEVCELLSISEATANNWMRLGKLNPIEEKLFDRKYIENLYDTIKNGKIIL